MPIERERYAALLECSTISRHLTAIDWAATTISRSAQCRETARMRQNSTTSDSAISNQRCIDSVSVVEASSRWFVHGGDRSFPLPDGVLALTLTDAVARLQQTSMR